MEIKWYGHSCFKLTSESGTSIVTDPPADYTGYKVRGIECDAVTVSHEHEDHCFMGAVAGTPGVIRMGDTPVKVGDICVNAVKWWHDDAMGAKRGETALFIFEMDGMRVMHAGDIGCLPDEATVKAIGHIDVLLVPIGGVYTIDGKQALELANMLHPKVVIPMHYKTTDCAFDIAPLAPFIDAAKDCAVHFIRDSEATLTKDSLGMDRVIAIGYDRPWAEEE